MQVRQLAVIAVLMCGLLPVTGQTAGLDKAGVDGALLTKANGGDVGAQVAVGDCYAAGVGRRKGPEAGG